MWGDMLAGFVKEAAQSAVFRTSHLNSPKAEISTLFGNLGPCGTACLVACRLRGLMQLLRSDATNLFKGLCVYM